MKVISGRGESAEAWVESLWPRIYRFIYYKLQNREEAEDLTQEVFHRVLSKVNCGEVKGENEKKMQAYSFTTARNLVTDLWRRRGRHPGTISIYDLEEQGWDIPQQPQKVEELILIREALAQLSPEHRRVLTWRIIQGRPVEEVARKMKRSASAVRTLQFRAVRSLREILEKGGYFNG